MPWSRSPAPWPNSRTSTLSCSACRIRRSFKRQAATAQKFQVPKQDRPPGLLKQAPSRISQFRRRHPKAPRKIHLRARARRRRRRPWEPYRPGCSNSRGPPVLQPHYSSTRPRIWQEVLPHCPRPMLRPRGRHHPWESMPPPWRLPRLLPRRPSPARRPPELPQPRRASTRHRRRCTRRLQVVQVSGRPGSRQGLLRRPCLHRTFRRPRSPRHPSSRPRLRNRWHSRRPLRRRRRAAPRPSRFPRRRRRSTLQLPWYRSLHQTSRFLRRRRPPVPGCGSPGLGSRRPLRRARRRHRRQLCSKERVLEFYVNGMPATVRMRSLKSTLPEDASV